VRYEGVMRPVRGMSAVVFGAGPAHALYFSCYEKMKRLFSGSEHGVGHPLAQGAAGALSTLLHDAIMSPADVVKQRMQVYNSPYQTCKDCLCKVYKAEGACAFYRSYTTQLLMNVPFQSIHFMTYEFCQELTNHERTYNPAAHMISGAISGAFAAAVTTPLDVCKTLLNTQEQQALHLTKQTHITGFINAAATVYRFSGIKGYFRGMQARVLYQIPATGLAWSVYEFFKYTLTLNHKTTHINSSEHTSLLTRGTSIESQHSSQSITALPVVYSK